MTVTLRLRERTHRPLLRLGTVAGSAVLAFMAVAPLTGNSGVVAVGGLLFVGSVVGLLTLSARDGCAVLTLLVVLLLLVPQDYVIVGPLKSFGNPTILVSLAALAIWAASRILGLSDAVALHPVRWVLLIFVVTTMLSYVAAAVRDPLVKEMASANRSVFTSLGLVGVALLAVDGLGGRERITTLLERIVLLGGLAAFFGILEFFTGFDYADTMLLPGLTANTELASDTRAGFERITAGATHAIEFSVVTAALVPLALHFCLHADPRRRWRFRLALVALLVALPMSVSRSGVLALLVALPIYAVVLSTRGRVNALVLGVLALGLLRAAIPGLLGTMIGLFRFLGNDPSVEGRTEDYQAIPALMEGHWWLGRGLGTFLPDVYFFLDNQFLGSLLAGGMIGLATYIALHVVGMGVAQGVRRRTRDPALRSEAQALVACIAGLGVAALTYDAFSFRQSSYLLFLAIGCAGAHWGLVHDRPKLRRRRRPASRPHDAVRAGAQAPAPAPSSPA